MPGELDALLFRQCVGHRTQAEVDSQIAAHEIVEIFLLRLNRVLERHLLELGLRQLHFHAGTLVGQRRFFFHVFLCRAIDFAQRFHVFIGGFERALRLEQLVVGLLYRVVVCCFCWRNCSWLSFLLTLSSPRLRCALQSCVSG